MTQFHNLVTDGLLVLLLARQDNIEVVKLLVEDGRFDFFKGKHDGSIPFYFACVDNHVNIVEYLLTHCDNIVIPGDRFDDKVEKILMKYR